MIRWNDDHAGPRPPQWEVARKTTEWAFSKLLAFDVSSPGSVYFQVSNRQRVTGVSHGTGVGASIEGTIAGSLAMFQSESDYWRVVAELEEQYRKAHGLWQRLAAEASA